METSCSKWSGEVEPQSIIEGKCIQSVSAAGRAALVVVLLPSAVRVILESRRRICYASV